MARSGELRNHGTFCYAGRVEGMVRAVLPTLGGSELSQKHTEADSFGLFAFLSLARLVYEVYLRQ